MVLEPGSDMFCVIRKSGDTEKVAESGDLRMDATRPIISAH